MTAFSAMGCWQQYQPESRFWLFQGNRGSDLHRPRSAPRNGGLSAGDSEVLDVSDGASHALSTWAEGVSTEPAFIHFTAYDPHAIGGQES
jgi:hypothetical protein